MAQWSKKAWHGRGPSLLTDQSPSLVLEKEYRHRPTHSEEDENHRRDHLMIPARNATLRLDVNGCLHPACEPYDLLDCTSDIRKHGVRIRPNQANRTHHNNQNH